MFRGPFHNMSWRMFNVDDSSTRFVLSFATQQESLKIYDSERTDLIAAKDNALQDLDLARR